jgi:hypothetical protein
MSLFLTEKKFHEVFGLQPHSEDFDGHLIDLYDISDRTYLSLLKLLSMPHIDALGQIFLNEDSNLDDFKEKILEIVLQEYKLNHFEKENVVDLF